MSNTITPISSLSVHRGYGITEKKKSELDLLSNDVLNAQHDVEQFQSIVSSLNEKFQNFQGFLQSADQRKTKALSNKTLLDQLVQSATDLVNNSKIAFDETVLADSNTKKLADHMKQLMDKLIYTANMTNKLSNMIIRKKALNPLISDELVSIISTAGKDADNAVALTLVALKSSFAAQATNMESEAAMALEYFQSGLLLEKMTTDMDPETVAKTKKSKKDEENTSYSLKTLIYSAYENARANYTEALKAFTNVTKELNEANSKLSKAQVKLKSLQSGLAAANAAALAS